jgi:hypothetical protein
VVECGVLPEVSTAVTVWFCTDYHSVVPKGNKTYVLIPTSSCYNYLFKASEMTSYKYEPIRLKGPAFRLLRLLQGDDDPIQCELFESKLLLLESAGDYTALS